MSESTTATTPATRAPGRAPVRRERVIGLYVSIAAVAFNTGQSQLHHYFGYLDAGGWRELPVYLGYAAFGYLTAFCLGMIAPHRLRNLPRSARGTAVVLACAGVLFSLFYFSALPAQYGAAVLLLVARAQRHSAATRLDLVLRVVAWLVALGPYVFAAARVVDSALH